MSQNNYEQLEQLALENFRNKNYLSALNYYQQLFYKYYNFLSRPYSIINNILVCLFNLEFSENIYKNFFFFLEKYFEEAKKSSDNTLKWANNILEDLHQYSIEMILRKFSKRTLIIEELKKHIEEETFEITEKFISLFYIPKKREKRFFFNSLLKIIHLERINFNRKGHYNQNIINTIGLINSFLRLTKNENVNSLRSDVYLLMSELVFLDPLRKDENFLSLYQSSLNFIEKSLKEFPQNIASLKKEKMIKDSIIIYQQLHLLDHDLNSKLATLKILVNNLKKDFNKVALEHLEFIVKYISSLKRIVEDSTPDVEEVDLIVFFNQFMQISPINFELKLIGAKEKWILNKDYLFIIFENLLKNSKEAYERNNIIPPDPPVVILIDFNEKKIVIKDWAGGIPKEFLENKEKIFEPYVSSKGIYQNVGLGLTIVKKACNNFFDIDYNSYNNSTEFELKYINFQE